jgi:hypothetical protein
MRKITLLLASGVAALLACDPMSDPLGVDPSVAQFSQVPEHVAGMAAHTFDIKQVSRGTSQAVGWCDEAAGIVRNSAPGTGTMTHIGRFRVEQTVCLNLATGVMTDGEATVIAANGDELYGTWHGTPVPGLTPPTWRLFYVITGGTGRFARAEGGSEMGLVMPTQSTWESTGEGWLRYYATDRSGN